MQQLPLPSYPHCLDLFLYLYLGGGEGTLNAFTCTPDSCSVACADGKPISASAVSVQTGKTYEQEFSLEIEKAKVGSCHRPLRRACPHHVEHRA